MFCRFDFEVAKILKNSQQNGVKLSFFTDIFALCGLGTHFAIPYDVLAKARAKNKLKTTI